MVVMVMTAVVMVVVTAMVTNTGTVGEELRALKLHVCVLVLTAHCVTEQVTTLRLS